MQLHSNVPCVCCTHLKVEGLEFTCAAFPRGIPAKILNGEDDHTKPLEGQGNDIVFEEIDQVKKALESD